MAKLDTYGPPDPTRTDDADRIYTRAELAARLSVLCPLFGPRAALEVVERWERQLWKSLPELMARAGIPADELPAALADTDPLYIMTNEEVLALMGHLARNRILN